MVSYNSVIFSYVYVIFSLNVVLTLRMSIDEYKYLELNSIEKVLFKDEKSTLAFLESQRESEPDKIDEVLRAYKSCFISDDVTLPSVNRKPFIVIEGNIHYRREEVSRSLAIALNATLLHSPPKCMYPLKNIFPNGLLKNAYFTLSLYAAAFNIKCILASNVPVIINGYWPGHASFIIGKIYKIKEELPYKGAEIYRQPEDLLKPNLCVFVAYVNRRDTMSSKFLPKLLTIYNRFDNLTFVDVEGSGCIDDVVDNIKQHITDKLGSTFNLSDIKSGAVKKPYVSFQSYMLLKGKSASLAFFSQEMAIQPLRVNTALQDFNNCFFCEDVPLPPGKRSPFIVIEGNYYYNREVVSKNLAQVMGAYLIHSPPNCMYDNRNLFYKGSLAKQAYYFLSLYASAFNVRQIISKGKPVVANGYWSEQASLIIVNLYKTINDLPPPGSDIYKKPDDLMMPDLLIFLNYSITGNTDAARQQIQEKHNQVVEIYKNLENTSLIIIDATVGVIAVVSQIQSHMIKLLGDKFNLKRAMDV